MPSRVIVAVLICFVSVSTAEQSNKDDMGRDLRNMFLITPANSSHPKLTSFVADRYPNLGNGAGFKPPAFECLDGEFVE